jgi:hypothetical protein
MNKPAIRFSSILKNLDCLFKYASNERDVIKRDACLSFITIKLHDQWNFRVRQIILESFGGTQANMIQLLRKKWSVKVMDKSWEPDWHIPNNSIRVAKILNVQNLYSIQSAIGAITCVDDLRWTRNVIVHNIPSAYEKFKKMALDKYGIKDISPHLFILEINKSSGNTIYEDWCKEIFNVLKVAL